MARHLPHLCRVPAVASPMGFKISALLFFKGLRLPLLADAGKWGQMRHVGRQSCFLVGGYCLAPGPALPRGNVGKRILFFDATRLAEAREQCLLILKLFFRVLDSPTTGE